MSNSENGKIPYFVEIRGCINCGVNERYREKYDHDYGFDEELIALCLFHGCNSHGHDLVNPYIDVEEVLARFNEKRDVLTPEQVSMAKGYFLRIKERFGEAYEKLGVSIDDLIEQVK